ncbi:calcium-binding protein [uncultured Tateyamaria sp.]|uniref:calcium-binding protein n=1 Tax=uncultured Tateyamaria sp. TaxID=455651 RepID=UPI00260F05E3|nr:calcium-binding protein [uncultured Tateyamaria sp.]
MLFLLSLFPALFADVIKIEDDVDAPARQEDEDIDQLLIGTIGDDNITGGEGDDDIIGLLGNDTLDGSFGDDVVQGLNGDDLLIGGAGDDAMQGRGDDDTVQGFAGDDWVDGNDGSDLVRGGAGDDVAIGGQGADIVDGRSGDDIVVGGELIADPLSNAQLGVIRDGGTLQELFPDGSNPLAGIRDDGAADQLFGRNGEDVLIMGAGDTAEGGSEVDFFAVIADSALNDQGPATITDFNSPEGEELALYFRSDEVAIRDAISVADDGDDALLSYDGEVLARITGAAGTFTADDVQILQFEDTDATPVIDGTEDSETLSGTGEDEIISGLGGDDTISGGAGDDEIIGGDGSDIVQGQAGFDRITGNAGNDYLQGRGGDDTVSGNAGNDWVNGNDGNDSVRGGTQSDTVIGGTGADTVVGGEGADVLIGGDLTGPLSNGSFGFLQDGLSLDQAVPPPVDGVIIPADDGDADVIDGGNRSDQIIFGAADTVTGGADADTFFALGSSAGADAGPGLITDYVAGEDALVIMTDIETPVITVINDGADALVQINGADVMRVQGGAGAVASGDITLSRGLDTNALFAPA